MTRPRTRTPRNSSLSLERIESALAWVSARSRRPLSLNVCPSFFASGPSVNDRENPVEAYGPGPRPDFPERAVIGKEDELRLADKVLRRHIAHAAFGVMQERLAHGPEAAIERIVAIFTHHKI